MVLDEGDKLFEQGDAGFRDQVATIFQACDNPKVRHVLFSATLANNVEEWSKLHLDNVVRINIGTRYPYIHPSIHPSILLFTMKVWSYECF